MADNVSLILDEVKKISRAISSGHGGLNGIGSATGSIGSAYSGGGYDGGGYPSSLREMRERFMVNREELKYNRDFSEIRQAKEDESFNKLREDVLRRRGKFDADDEKRARALAQKNAAQKAKEGAEIRKAERADARAKGAATAAIGREIGQKIGDAIEKIMDLYLTWYKFEQETAISRNKMMHNIMLNKMNNYGKILSTGIKNTLGSFIGGNINESANAAGRMGSDAMRAVMDMQITQLSEQTNFYTKKMQGRINAENKTIMAAAGALGAIAGAVATIPVAGWAAAAIFGLISGAITGIGAAITSFREADIQVAMERMEEFNRFRSETTKETVNDLNETMESYRKMSEDLTSNILKMGTMIMKTVSEFNYGVENVEKYKDALFNMNIEFSKLGKTLEDYTKIQIAYSETTGRAINLSGRDANNIFATGRLYGLDDNTTAQLYSGMNLFNISVEDGSDMLSKLYKQISNIGLSTRKFGKDLSKNIKLAEKYDFKNGVRGLAEMTAWAEKMRFNMDSLPSALDKVQQGGIEELLSNSAQLQVLGGNFAMYSDPMAMAYEAFNDPDAYAKRLTEMTKGMGYFDKSIGATRFSQSDIIRLQAYAKAAGLDYTDVRKQINEQQKQSEVMRTLRGSGWNDEQKSLLSSKAQWDMDEKTWKVSVMQRNAQGQYEYVSKKLSEISAGDIKNLVPEDKQDQLIDIAMRQLSVEERQLAATMESTAIMSNTNRVFSENEGLERVKIQQDNVKEMNEKFKNAHEKLQTIATKQYANNQEYALNLLDSQTGLISAYVEGQMIYLDQFNTNMQSYIDRLASLSDDINRHGGMLSTFGTLLRAGATMDETSIEGAITSIGQALNMGNISEFINEKTGHLKQEILDDNRLLSIFATGVSNVADLPGGGLKDEVKFFKEHAKDFTFGTDKDGRVSIKLNGENQIDNYTSTPWNYDYEDFKEKALFMNDGVITSNGSSHVIPVNDAIVRTHPNDTVLAAKPGGPFDTLFDGIFGMVKEIHSALSGSTASGNINVNVNGGIDLKSNGMNIESLRNNEMLKRAITEVVLENMSNKVNGGKNDMWKTNFRQ